MSGAVATGFGRGNSRALWWHLLGLDRSPAFDICQVPWHQLHLPSLLLGLVLGLLLAPVLDAFVALRVLLYHSISGRPAAAAPLPARRPAYRPRCLAWKGASSCWRVILLQEEVRDLREELASLRRQGVRRSSESELSSALDSPPRQGSVSSLWSLTGLLFVNVGCVIAEIV